MKIVRPITPLHRRMLEDMQIRNYSPHTIEGYLRYVGQFAKHFGVSPDRLGPEHIRTYQLHLLQKKVSKSMFIQTVCGLRFLYETTLRRPWMVTVEEPVTVLNSASKPYVNLSTHTAPQIPGDCHSYMSGELHHGNVRG
jgi:hypothetical protein